MFDVCKKWGPLFAAAVAWGQWTPPAGIPQPPFGIRETHTMYAGRAGYADAGSGPFTHYVDNSHPDCNDDGSGNPEKPLCSLPTALSTGDVVEIHGGPYLLARQWNFTANGTEEEPVFIRGADGQNPPVVSGQSCSGTGSYWILENVIFENAPFRAGDGSGSGDHHLSLRHSVVRDGSSGALVQNGGAGYVVFWDNQVYNNFRHPQDGHGFFVNSGGDYTWVVDNSMHHVTGDGIQFCHGCSEDPPEFVYIGRNVSYYNRENAIDIKYASNVVISENRVYDFLASSSTTQWCTEDSAFCSSEWESGSGGDAIVIGSDGAPVNTWILYNEIYNSARAIRFEEGPESYFVGNLVYGIHEEAISLEKNAIPLYIVNNTFHNAEMGIEETWRNNFHLRIYNNIFSEMAGEMILITSDPIWQNSEMAHNLFWNDGNSLAVRWGSDTYDESTGWESFPSGPGNAIADPLFLDAPAGDFSLRSGSPAIAAANGQLTVLDSLYKSLFGQDVSIMKYPGMSNDLGAIPFGSNSDVRSGKGREENVHAGLAISTNPFTFEIKINFPESPGDYELRIYDILGKSAFVRRGVSEKSLIFSYRGLRGLHTISARSGSRVYQKAIVF